MNQNKATFAVFDQNGDPITKHSFSKFEMAFDIFKKATLQQRDRICHLAINRPSVGSWVRLLDSKDIS